ncbi:unnamed protein product [Mytilus edulis]|uniref:Chromo domain-containing protein n=1 Tax=Mytilus edulis TaxID=6550 RepID=A0A8S3VKD5_MYTED|nr:unnamed protein product [Mytilus edulis]
MYMVKWEGYSVYECSWEPEAHLNQVLLNTFYTPEIDDSRLALSARNFELAIQQRLRGKHNTVIIRFDLDVFRHCFGIENSYILQSVDETLGIGGISINMVLCIMCMVLYKRKRHSNEIISHENAFMGPIEDANIQEHTYADIDENAIMGDITNQELLSTNISRKIHSIW